MALTSMELLYGPIMLGIVLNVLLYGIMTTQTYYYYVHYKTDRAWMKGFVALLFFADTLNTAFDVTFLYQRLIVLPDDSPKLGQADWIFNTDPAMTSIIAFFVQGFFAWRVKVVTNSLLMVILVLFCSFAQLMGGLATAIACGIVSQFAEFQKFQVVVIIWLVFAAVADVAIAAALVSHLRSHRTGFAATDDIITKITRMTVSTGAITAVCATIDLVAFLASTSGLHLAFNMPLAKLYTNSLLSSLNARRNGSYSENSGERSDYQARSLGISGRPDGATVLGARRADIVEFHGGKGSGGVNVTVTRSVDVEETAIHKANMFESESHEMDVKC